MDLYEQPAAALARDACTCRDLRQGRQSQPLCSACDAWEEGYVQIGGRRRYLRSLWIRVNRPDKGDKAVEWNS